MRFALVFSLAATAALAACTSPELTWTFGPDGTATRSPGGGGAKPASGAPAMQTAVASLSPAASGGATGLVTFTPAADGLDVRIVASGLTPGMAHGIHVHEHGNCASADFTSAGGHFNPEGRPHGPQSAPHHAGDMPNIVANSQGNVDTRFAVAGAKLVGPTGLVGHAFVVHAGTDDYQTQPSGNSGARVACGVITAQ